MAQCQRYFHHGFLLHRFVCPSYSQEATAVAVTADGEFIVAGWTWGDYFGDNAGSSDDQSKRPILVNFPFLTTETKQLQQSASFHLHVA